MQPPHDTQTLPATASQSEPVFAPSPRRRGTGVKIGIGVAIALLVLVAAGIGLEIVVRESVKGRLERQATSVLGSPATVSLGPGLVLPSVLTQRLSSVHISAPGSASTQQPSSSGMGGQPKIAPTIDFTAQGASTEGDSTHLDSLEGQVTLTDAQMVAAATNAPGVGDLLSGLTTVQSITSDPATQTIRVSIGGLAQATVKPVLANGRVDLAPQEASILGFRLPSNLLGGTISLMDQATSDLPKGVEVTGVQVIDHGIRFTISGRDVTLAH